MLTYLRCLFRTHNYCLQQNSRAYHVQKLYSKTKTKTSAEKFNKRTMDDWLQCGDYDLYVWSISGLETCVVVKSSDLLVAFDIGYAVRESVGCKHVFIRYNYFNLSV